MVMEQESMHGHGEETDEEQGKAHQSLTEVDGKETEEEDEEMDTAEEDDDDEEEDENNSTEDEDDVNSTEEEVDVDAEAETEAGDSASQSQDPQLEQETKDVEGPDPKDQHEEFQFDISDGPSMLRVIQSLPEEEARRHEQFRRSHFERGAIKRCMAEAIQRCTAADRKPPTVTHVMSIVMAGMTKVFVGELTAEARRIMEKNGETGPIQPRHLREAQRKYYRRHPLARGRTMRRLIR